MFENFIPEVWAEKIERDLERDCVFAEDCNRNYEGKAKKVGDTVHILGVGKPTIKSLDRKNAGGRIDEAEAVEDTSVSLVIDQIRYFNYKVDDIDKAQAVGGVMDALSAEANEGLANEEDKFLAGLVTDEAVPRMYNAGAEITVTADNVLDIIDDAAIALYGNDVKQTTPIVITIPPRFFKLFKKAYIKADTNNSEMLKNGKVAQYGNITVKMSNNVYTKDGVDYVPIRTKRAMAFVHAHTHTEAYRPENSFSDAVKGYILFGGKIVRPKEIFALNVKY